MPPKSLARGGVERWTAPNQLVRRRMASEAAAVDARHQDGSPPAKEISEPASLTRCIAAYAAYMKG